MLHLDISVNWPIYIKQYLVKAIDKGIDINTAISMAHCWKNIHTLKCSYGVERDREIEKYIPDTFYSIEDNMRKLAIDKSPYKRI